MLKLDVSGICPVCKQYVFEYSYEDCPICNWTHDEVQEDFPDWAKCANIMSLNEARQAYKEGKEVY